MFGVLCLYLLVGCSSGRLRRDQESRRTPFFVSGARRAGRLPLLQLRHPDHGRLRGPGRGHRARPLAGDHRGPDRPDLPGHRGRGDRRQPAARPAPPAGPGGVGPLSALRRAQAAARRGDRAGDPRRHPAVLAVPGPLEVAVEAPRDRAPGRRRRLDRAVLERPEPGVGLRLQARRRPAPPRPGGRSRGGR